MKILLQAFKGGIQVNSEIKDPWIAIEKITGKKVPKWVKEACKDPKLVTIPVGRTLYGAGTIAKRDMESGAFEELDSDWYLQGNQLDPDWYKTESSDQVILYEYSVVIEKPTTAVMSEVVDQPGAPRRVGPQKFQFYNPAGLGEPIRGRILGRLKRPRGD